MHRNRSSGRARRGLIGALACVAFLSAGVPAASAAPERPLVYVISLDGLDGDRIDQGKAPFISSLLAGQGANATYFPDSRSVIPAETNPNHTAMMTGAFPGRSGIPANAFALYAPLENEDTCLTTGPVDFASPPSETSGESSSCPEAEMTFESIRRQGNPDGLALAGIFGKPKLGRIFSGRNFREDRRDIDYLWAPCSSGADDDEYCEEVQTNPVSGYAMDDKTVMDRVIASSSGIQAGDEVRRPDFTFVNLHQIDTAGHSTTPGGLYDTAIGQADDEIERLVATLRARGEWERSVLILVSDHSMDATPTKLTLTDTLTEAGIPEDAFVVVQNGSVDSIYLSDRTAPGRHELLKRMRDAVLAETGVAEALYRKPNPVDGADANTIESVHPDWDSAGPRSADLLVTSEPGVAFSDPSSSSNPLPGNHGAPQTRDNFLAVVSGGPLVEQRTSSASPQNTDVAPSVMGLFGLAAPADSKGDFLADAFDRRELKRVSRPHRPLRVRLRGRRVSIKPKHGRYDVQVRKGRYWRFIARDRAMAKLKLPRSAPAKPRVRARLRSAAAVKGPWAKAR